MNNPVEPKRIARFASVRKLWPLRDSHGCMGARVRGRERTKDAQRGQKVCAGCVMRGTGVGYKIRHTEPTPLRVLCRIHSYTRHLPVVHAGKYPPWVHELPSRSAAVRASLYLFLHIISMLEALGESLRKIKNMVLA